MVNGRVLLTTVLFALFLPWNSHGQEAQAPVYKKGDWWRVKFQSKPPTADWPCLEGYSEFLVRINRKGKARVYGVEAATEKRIKCRRLAKEIFGTIGKRVNTLAFPLYVGKRWEARIGRWSLKGGGAYHYSTDVYEVQRWEKVQTPLGILEAFKVSRSGRRTRWNYREIYYYSPEIKVVVLKIRKSPKPSQIFAIVDFSVTN